MSDTDEPRDGVDDGAGRAAGEPVGSVGEEAAKLFGALSGWALDQGADLGDAGGVGRSLGDAARRVDEHLATGGADCRWCPVCQVIGMVRQTSPEVRTHLTAAAGSLVQAVAALLATPPGRGEQVEKIDLDDGSPWDEQDWDGER